MKTLENRIYTALSSKQGVFIKAYFTRLSRTFTLVEPILFCVLILLNTWNLFGRYHMYRRTESLHEIKIVPHMRTDGARLPNALIIGASKCGTIPFAGFLRLNPKIAFTGHWPRFYNHDETYNKGIQWYSSQFADLNATDDQIILDGNAAYLTDPKVPSRVAAVDPKIKIIMILREPINRMVSDYAQAIVAKRKAANLPEMPFRDVFIDKRTHQVNIVTPGLIWSVYEVHIRRWLQYFPLSQMHVIDGEEFLRDPLGVVNKAESFLGLPHVVTKRDLAFNRTTGYFCVKRPTYVQCFGHGRNWNRPYVDKDTHIALLDFFKPYNEKLFSLVNKRFTW